MHKTGCSALKFALHICGKPLKPLQNGACVVYSLCLGPLDMKRFGNPCFNVLWPSQLSPRLGGLRGATFLCRKNWGSPVNPKEV